MKNSLKEQLYRRYRAGVREHIAKQEVPPRMAARVSASCRKTFELAWARGNGQGLVSKENKVLIYNVASYGEVVAHYAEKRLHYCDRLKNPSREDKLFWTARVKAKQLRAEALLRTNAKERPEGVRKLKKSIGSYKRRIIQQSEKWGLEPIEINEKANELIAGSRSETVCEDELLQPNEATKTA